jgi:hypothetical protein
LPASVAATGPPNSSSLTFSPIAGSTTDGPDNAIEPDRTNTT